MASLSTVNTTRIRSIYLVLLATSGRIIWYEELQSSDAEKVLMRMRGEVGIADERPYLSMSRPCSRTSATDVSIRISSDNYSGSIHHSRQKSTKIQLQGAFSSCSCQAYKNTYALILIRPPGIAHHITEPNYLRPAGTLYKEREQRPGVYIYSK